jgi:hypothetical protein
MCPAWQQRCRQDRNPGLRSPDLLSPGGDATLDDALRQTVLPGASCPRRCGARACGISMRLMLVPARQREQQPGESAERQSECSAFGTLPGISSQRSGEGRGVRRAGAARTRRPNRPAVQGDSGVRSRPPPAFFAGADCSCLRCAIVVLCNHVGRSLWRHLGSSTRVGGASRRGAGFQSGACCSGGSLAGGRG